MITRRLLDGYDIPVLGLGTMGIGGDHEPDFSKDKSSIESIQNAINMGYSHIDTAEIYGQGHAEEIVGLALKNIDRKKIFITSKVWKENLGYHEVIKAAKGSLQRLNTNYIDLYLVHSPNPLIPIKQTMKAFDILVDQGLVRSIGVSNFDIPQLEQAQRYARNKIVANELKCNFWAKTIDFETIKYCQKQGIIVIAHKPFGRGKISTDRIELLSQIAKKYNKSEAQIVLRWLIQKNNLVTIFKAENFEHQKENLAIFEFKISDSDSSLLDGLVHV